VGRRILLTLVVVAAVSLAACGGDDGGNGGPAGSGSADTVPGRGGGVASVHTVSALEPVARELVDAYNGTSDTGIELAVQPQDQAIQAVSQGSSAILPGVWLSGVDADTVAIGRNLAIIAVPAGNPAGVTGVEALAPGSPLDTELCGPNSQVGNFAALVAARGGVHPDPSRIAEGCEADALARVARGELDAALVFRANLPIPDGVEVVNIPDDQNIVIDVSYAPAAGNPDPNSFQSFLATDQAAQVLSKHGLLP
jgi:molybdate transport system substrate-binding protein